MTSLRSILWPLPRRVPFVVDVAEAPPAFPADFVWGTATADHQIEHAQDDDWTAFEQKTRREKLEQPGPDGHPLPGHLLRAASDPEEWFAKKADFDRLMEEDLDRAKALGTDAFRFSISWARLFPTPSTSSSPDPAGLAFYDRLFAALAARGLKPFVTLFHFAIPRWLGEPDAQGRRGVEREDAPAHFERFAATVAQRWGAQVFQWCTLNEPMVYAYLGYLDGMFPPNERRGDPKAVAPVAIGLLKMHARAYAAIKAGVPSSSVGIATHVRRFMPWRNGWILDRVTTAMVDQAFHHDLLEAIETGVYRPVMTGVVEEIPGLKGTRDYLGLNFYGRYYVKTGLVPGRYTVVHHDPHEAGEEKNDLGWAMDEGAFTHELVRFAQRYRLPIWILENGTADRGHDGGHDDVIRQRFLVRHARAMARAMERGADVRGYFVWSLLDNFEWAEGFTGRFGLFHVDFGGDFARHPRGSVDVYRAIVTNRGVPAELWARHRRR
jgi:beta-glucosidase